MNRLETRILLWGCLGGRGYRLEVVRDIDGNQPVFHDYMDAVIEVLRYPDFCQHSTHRISVSSPGMPATRKAQIPRPLALHVLVDNDSVATKSLQNVLADELESWRRGVDVMDETRGGGCSLPAHVRQRHRGPHIVADFRLSVLVWLHDQARQVSLQAPARQVTRAPNRIILTVPRCHLIHGLQIMLIPARGIN